MRELYAHKQVRCKHCEFDFPITGFGGVTMIVCPACGEENSLPSPPPASATLPVEEESKVELPESPPQSVSEKPLLCSVEHCPLLTGHEAGHAIAEKMGLRLRQRKRRRRTILAWTVTLQLCVMIGAACFIAKTVSVPEPTVSTVFVSRIEEKETTMSVGGDSQPAASEHKIAGNIVPNNAPLLETAEPEQAVLPPEQDIFSLLAHEHSSYRNDPPITPPSMLVTPVQIPEATLPPPLAIEPVTLEMAEEFLASARVLLATDPERSVNQAVRAAKIYEQYGQSYPESLYWILGNAFASLSWGDPLLESSLAIETMALSPDNRWLLAQLRDKKVWLLDLQRSEGRQAEYLLDSGTAEYVKFVFSPDLRWILGGQKNGTIRIWDMWHNNPGATTITFVERIPDLQDLQISPNGGWLAAFGRAPHGLGIVQNPLPGQLKPSQPIKQVAYQRADRDPNDSVLYPVLLWNLRQMDVGIVPRATVIPSVPQPVQIVRFSPNSDQIAVGRKDAVVRVHDLLPSGAGEDPFILRGHQLGITQIAFAPNGQWIATGSQDNTVRLWNLTSAKGSPESATLHGHIGWISTLTIDKTGEYLFSGSYDRTIRIWSVKNDRIGTALKEEPIVLETNLGVPDTLLLTRDGDKMITLGREGSLGIYHLPSLLGDGPIEDIRAITFRNSKLAISKCTLTSDNQLLIFSYDHLTNLSNNGIRLWALQPQMFLQ